MGTGLIAAREERLWRHVARRWSGSPGIEIEPVGIVENAGEATKLTVYFGRHDRVYGVPAFEVICEVLYRHDIPGATALLGVDGTAHGRQQARLLTRSANLPMMMVAVGSGDQIGMILPEPAGLLPHLLMTVEPVRICKRDGQLINVPERAGHPGSGDVRPPQRGRAAPSTLPAASHPRRRASPAVTRSGTSCCCPPGSGSC